MTNRTVLVTGGAGYIGSHACKALALAGYQPVVFDNLVYGHDWAVKWGPLEQGDLLDGDRLDQVFKRHKPVAVVHFAAYAYVGESVSMPLKYYTNNVAGSLSLFRAMLKHGVEHLVFSSTCATYGNPQNPVLDEAHPQNPINPYGRTKLMVEAILRDFDQAYNLRSTSLRYFNAAGADLDGELGEVHDPETHLIPLALRAAAGSGAPLTIFGDDYPTPDGSCVRDYIHVSDLANAHVLALGGLEKGVSSGCYNLGTGRGYSVKEVVSTTQAGVGAPVPHSIGARRAGDPPSLVANAELFSSRFGWEPGVSDLETILESAWRWERQSGHTGP
jgi:UDP-arabinose 4-epimerase